MKAHMKLIPCVVSALALTVVNRAAAQDTMQAMPMPQRPAASSSTPAPASSSTQDTNISPTRHAHAVQPASASSAGMQSMPPPSGQHEHASHANAAAASGGTQSMPAMQGMPTAQQKPSAPVETQQLHFGDMLGRRPEPGGLASGMHGANMSSMQGMDMSSMQGGNAPPDARSADYSDGHTYGAMRGMDMQDESRHGMLLLDQLEYAHTNDGHAIVIDGQAWYGGDIDKLWLKFEGEHAEGKLQDLRTEALWNHAVSAYWNTQLGVRHDFGEGPGRNWAAFGVQGLAPYWFDTEATLYVGQGGRTAARFETEYELLLTQRLILQPRLEVNLYGKDDPQRGIGSGLSDVEVGLRLRYEIRREFAPYIGVVRVQRFGRTADFARAASGHADETQFVAGLRMWF